MMVDRFKHSWLVKCLMVSMILVSAINVNCKRIPEDWESQIFKKYVIKPIPKSVMNIKVDKLTPGGLFASGRKYIIHFKISKKDLALILKSRAFMEYEWITYKKFPLWGKLWWGNKLSVDHREHQISRTNSHEMAVYKDSEQPPEWFRPNDWDKPKVYSISEKWGRSRRYRANVLIFNEDSEEAYFFENVPGH